MGPLRAMTLCLGTFVLGSAGTLFLLLMNPFELLSIAASLMQNLAVIVVNIDPKIQLVIAGSQI
jgi:hypothetical protein